MPSKSPFQAESHRIGRGRDCTMESTNCVRGELAPHEAVEWDYLPLAHHRGHRAPARIPFVRYLSGYVVKENWELVTKSG